MSVLKSVYGVVFGLAAAGLWGCDAGDSPTVPNPEPVQGVARDASAEIPAGLAVAEGGADGEADDVGVGRDLFMSTCSACHGASAQGMPNQGPDLRLSQLISRSSDADLVAFVSRGRTPGEPGSMMGLPMPPRGGNAALSDRHLGLIARYLRSVQAQANQPPTERP